MANILAKRYCCPDCKSEYLVITEGKDDMSCCGKAMELKTDQDLGKYYEPEYKGVATPRLGRRYVCEECGKLVVCTKPGEKVPSCCGKMMTLRHPRKIGAAF